MAEDCGIRTCALVPSLAFPQLSGRICVHGAKEAAALGAVGAMAPGTGAGRAGRRSGHKSQQRLRLSRLWGPGPGRSAVSGSGSPLQRRRQGRKKHNTGPGKRNKFGQAAAAKSRFTTRRLTTITRPCKHRSCSRRRHRPWRFPTTMRCPGQSRLRGTMAARQRWQRRSKIPTCEEVRPWNSPGLLQLEAGRDRLALVGETRPCLFAVLFLGHS